MNFVIWLYGLSSAGKTTLAKEFLKRNKKFILLDGDDIRDIFDNDLGFTNDERDKQAIRLIKLCNVILKSNINIILCTNSPTEKNRNIFRKNIENLYEVYINCNIKECIRRDVKGLYKKNLNGKIKNIPGLDLEFETPEFQDLTINTDKLSISESLDLLEEKFYLYEYMR